MEIQLRRPYPELCRTSYFMDQYSICHVDRCTRILPCPYVVEFGYRYFCRHPERRTFAGQENKERQRYELSF